MSAQSAEEAVLTTTIKMTAELRAKLDIVRAGRTRRTGRRPATNELFIEAIEQWVERVEHEERGHQ